MKTHFYSNAIILFPLSIFSQSNSFGVGVEFSDKSEGLGINFSYDHIFFEKKKIPFLVGIEYSIGTSDFYTNDMTGYIGYNEYPEDYTGEIYNTFNQIELMCDDLNEFFMLTGNRLLLTDLKIPIETTFEMISKD